MLYSNCLLHYCHYCCHYNVGVTADDDDENKVKEEMTAMLEDRVKCEFVVVE